MQDFKVDVVTKFTLTTLTAWLNDNVEKKDAKPGKEKFSVSDVQGYIKRGTLPSYVKKGFSIRIEKAMDIPGAKLYKLREIKLTKR